MALAQVNMPEQGNKGPSRLENALAALGMLSSVASVAGNIKGLMPAKNIVQSPGVQVPGYNPLQGRGIR